MKAQARGLEVRGILWVFDRLVEDCILDPADLCTRLTRAREAGHSFRRMSARRESIDGGAPRTEGSRVASDLELPL